MGVLTDIAAGTTFTETVFDPIPNTFTRVASANPERFAIGFACSSGGNMLVSTNGQTGLPHGMSLDRRDVQWINVKDHGALAQAEWFASGIAGPSLTVWEILIPGG